MGFEKIRKPLLSAMGLNSSSRVVVSSTELLALFTTPKTIAPAPKAGYAHIFMGAEVSKPAGTAYNLTTATGLAVKYTNAAGTVLGQAVLTGFLDAATAQQRWVRPLMASAVPTDITPVNGALVLHVLTANVTTGTGGLTVRAHFITVPLVP